MQIYFNFWSFCTILDKVLLRASVGVVDICLTVIITDRRRCEGDETNRCYLNPGHVSFSRLGRKPLRLLYPRLDKTYHIRACIFVVRRDHTITGALFPAWRHMIKETQKSSVFNHMHHLWLDSFMTGWRYVFLGCCIKHFYCWNCLQKDNNGADYFSMHFHPCISAYIVSSKMTLECWLERCIFSFSLVIRRDLIPSATEQRAKLSTQQRYSRLESLSMTLSMECHYPLHGRNLYERDDLSVHFVLYVPLLVCPLLDLDHGIITAPCFRPVAYSQCFF